MALSSSTANHSVKKTDTVLSSESKGAIVFGKYRVFPRRGQLVAGQQVIDLGGRAFAVLLALLEAEGRIVTKEELLKRVWSGTLVDEHTISVHISNIRRALGEDRDLIATDSGRGYRFTGAISSVGSERGVDVALGVVQTNITAPLSALVGRETALSELSELLSAHRLVTLAGAGGIGKTRLATEVARVILPSLPGGAWIAELAPLGDSKLVAATIATALGMSLGSNGDLVECLKAMSSGEMLLVLDNCEHVVDWVAHLAELLLRSIPALRILATSQETLGAEGEYVYQVSPLEVPPEGFADVDRISRFSAVQLFAKRVNVADQAFLLSDQTATTVGTICRRLDGIPLAIELAAARVETLGLMEVAKRLGDRFRLLTGGRRTALPRHRALWATLEWSCGLLEEREQTIFRRLGIFANGFTLAGAAAVAGGKDIDHIAVADVVTSLVKKSLVTADVRRMIPRYRLLETTRAYALEKLADRAEFVLAAGRHAVFFRQLLEGMETDCGALPAPELMARYAPEIDNVRAALEWSFGHDEDLQTGVALAAASIPLWALLSLFDECRDWTARALARLGEGAAAGRHEMLLQAALGMSLMWAKGPVSAVCEAWKRSLSLAEALSDTEYQVRALYGLWVFHLRIAELRQALSLAEQLKRVAETAGDLSGVLTAARLIGTSLHFIGEQGQARLALQGVIESERPKRHLHHLYVMRFGIDQRIAALTCQARMNWVQGFPDRAWRGALAAVEEAEILGHGGSLCMALGEGACSVAALRGDVAAVGKFAMTLNEYAEKFGHHPYRMLGSYFNGWVLMGRGEVERGYALLRAGFASVREGSIVLRANMALAGVYFYDVLTSPWLRIDMIEGAEPLLSSALSRFPREDACWCTAELLRLKGEFGLIAGVAQANEMAERCFIESLSVSRESGSHSWELRTATSLARLWSAQSRAAEARALLSDVYKKFDEGFDTVDLCRARSFLEEVNSVTN
jgi:predicted ATPase/DNA-binding winged helix-turn-helix (wHTH) protein